MTNQIERKVKIVLSEEHWKLVDKWAACYGEIGGGITYLLNWLDSVNELASWLFRFSRHSLRNIYNREQTNIRVSDLEFIQAMADKWNDFINLGILSPDDYDRLQARARRQGDFSFTYIHGVKDDPTN